MSRKRRKFTREFKVEALRLVEESGKPLTQVARELGVRADLLYSWKRQSSKASNAEEVFPGNGTLIFMAHERMLPSRSAVNSATRASALPDRQCCS
jgi:transposase